MDQFIQKLFSMRMMTVGMFIFLLAIGAATFLESAYDIQTAKLMIYNALWFEILLVYLSINLIANIFRYNLLRKEKIASLMFHVSFLVIMIGAAITRFVSFEGLMLIREGSSSNYIYSSDPHLWYRVNDGKMQYTANQKMFQSEQYNHTFSNSFQFPNHPNEIQVEFVQFRKNLVDSLVIDKKFQDNVLEIVTGGMTSNYLEKGGFLNEGNVPISFADKNAPEGIKVSIEKGAVYFVSDFDLMYLPMEQMVEYRQKGIDVPDSAFVQVAKGTKELFRTSTLYNVLGEQIVFKGIIRNARKMLLPTKVKNAGSDYLTVRVTDGKESKEVDLEGGMGRIPAHEVFTLGGLTYEMEYGSTRIELPFSIECRDFRLQRYPGSNSPSSFESDLTILDEKNNVRDERSIYMNHVMDYGGYRFFQSSYDEDEKGTRLSVNHDYWGTTITYIGYFLMFLGMMLALFAKQGRFVELIQKIKGVQKRKETLTMLILLAAFTSFGSGNEHAGHDHPDPNAKKVVRFMSEDHANELATLPVQDPKGRIIPMHTMCDQILRKLSRKSKFDGKGPIEVVVSMHMYPDYWMEQPIIYVNSNLLEKLGLNSNYCSYKELSNGDGAFKLEKEYNSAFRKMESKRNEFDKKVIKLGEKFQICNEVFLWQFMKLIPLKGDAANRWAIPFDEEIRSNEQAQILSSQCLNYISSLDSCAKTGDFTFANNQLGIFKANQKAAAGEVLPSESKLSMEVRYNKMNIFKNSMYAYLIGGLVILILFFVGIFKMKPLTSSNKAYKIIRYLLIAIFLYHGAGLAMRWGITGHAPWSNGYEAIVFIAFITFLAGILFSNKMPVVLAAGAVLAMLMIFVSEMNLMDPEITPLQPVLKSYWLMIHVAIITGSYGFLGLSTILSLINLVLYIGRTERNGKHISLQINELTYVAEMTMTVGLFMLTIGTFLGGIWANESWGRYWGWDPKETWALVSVLVYAIVLHLRFIPGMNSKFTFNVASMWGYSAILFTFFGVNFYLVGLHSYAQGEGLGTIPVWLILTVIVFVLFTILAAIKNHNFKKING